MTTTYRATCPSCGRGIGATVPSDGSVKMLRHQPGDGTKDWCPGSGVLVTEFTEVEAAGRVAKPRRPLGRDGADSRPACWTCKSEIDPADYWRAIWPGFPAGAFVSICGPECPKLGDATPFERVKI